MAEFITHDHSHGHQVSHTHDDYKDHTHQFDHSHVHTHPENATEHEHTRHPHYDMSGPVFDHAGHHTEMTDTGENELPESEPEPQKSKRLWYGED